MQFTYDNSGERESATYRGFTVRIERDGSPSNPFEEWDGQPPFVTYYERDMTEYGDGALSPLSGLSDSWINRRWKEALEAIGCDVSAMEADVRDRAAGERIADTRRDYLESALEEARPSRYGGNAGDYFESVAKLWRLQGVAALASSTSGYSQGDYANCLAVATPAWIKSTGIGKAHIESALESAGKLYGAYAWGDVYGYVVVSADGDELDSCWGYYGDNHEESGLAESARDAIDYTIRAAMLSRVSKLKQLIRNRVPLNLRPAMLAVASNYSRGL